MNTRRSKKKYDWKIGYPLPLLDEHSVTKHLLVSEYLKRYVEVYMSNANIPKLSLTIVDGFAGGGLYLDALTDKEVYGSPFLILEAIKEAEVKLNIERKVPRVIDTEYHFVEKQRAHYDFLEHEIHQSEYHYLLNSKVLLYRKAFKEAIHEIIDRIHKRNRAQRAIFILDQYAYSDVPFSIIKNILTGICYSEIILTFNFDSLQGFISDTATNRKALGNIDLEKYIDWRRLEQFKETGMWKSAIQEQLGNAIFRASGAKHITLFFITPKKGWSYWLVHLSQVYKARDVMMDLHWKYSNTSSIFSHHLTDGIFTLGYKAVETPGQSTFDFKDDFNFGEESKKRCIGSLSEKLPELIFNEPKSIVFSQLTEKMGSFTPASEADIKSAIQSSMDINEIVVRTKDGGVRRSSREIKSDDSIEYLQRPLFVI